MSSLQAARRSMQCMLSRSNVRLVPVLGRICAGQGRFFQSASILRGTTSLIWNPNANAPIDTGITSSHWFSSKASAVLSTDIDSDSDDESRYFSELKDLNPRTLELLQKKGIDCMTDIQDKTWDAVVSGKDVLGKSRTGSGKTLAFLLPTLERLLQESNHTQCRMLIISPTRELASQIHKTVADLVKAQDGIQAQVLYGGVSKGADMKRFDRRKQPTIVTATPGRLLDHLENSWLNDRDQPFADCFNDSVDILVLDEMDRLLDLGFRQDIQRIISYLPEQPRQTLLFSATVPPSVQKEVQSYLQPDHLTVDCIQDEDPNLQTVKTVKQSHVIVPRDQMIAGVVQLIEHILVSSSSEKKNAKLMVFCNTTSQTTFLTQLFQTYLQNDPTNSTTTRQPIVLELHSKLSQNSRSNTSERFRRSKSAILFTSDVSARGVDYPDVSHVIQVGCARDRETYIHRLGRTARAGKEGEGLVVLLPDELDALDGLLSGIEIPHNLELQQDLESTATSSDNNSKRLERALDDWQVAEKGADCYRGMFGFYFQQFREWGMRKPADTVFDLINSFADQARLQERPTLSHKVLKQYGVLDHPSLSSRPASSYQGGSGFDQRRHHRSDFSGRGRGDQRRGNNESFGRKGGSDKKRNGGSAKGNRRRETRW